MLLFRENNDSLNQNELWKLSSAVITLSDNPRDIHNAFPHSGDVTQHNESGKSPSKCVQRRCEVLKSNYAIRDDISTSPARRKKLKKRRKYFPFHLIFPFITRSPPSRFKWKNLLNESRRDWIRKSLRLRKRQVPINISIAIVSRTSVKNILELRFVLWRRNCWFLVLVSLLETSAPSCGVDFNFKRPKWLLGGGHSKCLSEHLRWCQLSKLGC